MIFSHRRIATRKLGELVKPLPGGKEGGSPGCDGNGFRWVHFRFLTVCHVWWGEAQAQKRWAHLAGAGVVRARTSEGDGEEVGVEMGGRPAAVRAP